MRSLGRLGVLSSNFLSNFLLSFVQVASVRLKRKPEEPAVRIGGRDRHAEEQKSPGPIYQELNSSSMKYPTMYKAGSLRTLHEKKMALR